MNHYLGGVPHGNSIIISLPFGLKQTKSLISFIDIIFNILH